MNAQVKELIDFIDIAGVIGGWEAGEQRVKGRTGTVKGYALKRGAKTLGFIETTQPMKRIEELLEQYTAPHNRRRTARELMRGLLNSEDYRSNIYDVIVRVYYSEDFA